MMSLNMLIVIFKTISFVLQLGSSPPLSSYIQDLGSQIGTDQQANVHHEPIAIPNTSNVFPSDEVVELFHQALSDADADNMIPEGFLLSDDNWLDGYPTHEMITIGTLSGKNCWLC